MLPSLTRHGDLLVAYLSPQRPRVLLLAALLLSSIGLELANPQVVRFFYPLRQQPIPPRRGTCAERSCLRRTTLLTTRRI
jgi:ATP-binding cassette, subfamily B, bacterial